MTVTELAAHQPVDRSSTSDRWRPTRAGIINIWRYYGETFSFHEGRLLLRGPNGTGKSKALELLLPYLLDANLRPHRLSTFGSGDRTMHWNLMGEGSSGRNRVGYVWLEFGRIVDGEKRWFSCGARLAASENTKNVASTYFTTTKRIGLPDGLALVNAAGRPLVRADLATAIGDEGEVHPSPGEYRRTIRQTLFPGVNEQRYDALISALLQLRTPKLSERLDPAVLSTLLSRALPPLDHTDIAEIAEGFERLDRQREQLADLDTEVAAAETLAARQRTYAQRVLRAAAANLIAATSTMTELTRAARESKEKLKEANRDLERVTTRDAELAGEATTTEARIQAIVDLPAYQEGRRLDQLRRDVLSARDRAGEATRHAAKLRERADEDASAAQDAVEAAERVAQLAARGATEARLAADRAGMPAVYEEIDATADLKTSRRLLRAAVDSRSGQVRAVRQALGTHQQAVTGRERAESDLEGAREELATATALVDTARREHEQALADLGEELVRWARGCRQLAVPEPELLADLAGDRAAVDTIVADLSATLRERFAGAETTLRGERGAVLAERRGHEVERERLERKVDRLPPAPHTRGADRTTLAGAPLWRVVDFRAGVPAETQAAVEAGLEAAGLLDAWVLPDGAVAAPDADVFAEALLAVPAPGRSLNEILAVEPDSPVVADRVRALLAGIAFGDTAPDHQAAVGADGAWRLASAHGRWHKTESEYLGASARERTRQRRIAELNELIGDLDRRVEVIDEALRDLTRQRAELAGDLDQRPGYAALDDAEREQAQAEQRQSARADVVARAERTLAAAEQAATRALRALTSAGSEHGLPTSETGLSAVDAAVQAFRAIGDDWLDSRHDATTRASSASAAAARAAATAGTATDAEDVAVARREEAETAAVTLAEVERSVGAEFRTLADDLSALRERLKEIGGQRERLRGEDIRLSKLIGTLGERHDNDESKKAGAAAVRDEYEGRFRELAMGSLPADARVELDAMDSKRSVLDAARRLAERLGRVPHEARNVRDAEATLANAVHDAQQTLAGRVDLSLEPDEDVRVFTATVDGVRHGAAALLDLLRTERERTAEQITAGERELFDKTLTGDTRRHLADRIRAANELVDTMNARLERVRTASKVRVSLVWQVDPQLPPGTREARNLLLRNPAGLGESEREALHRFFRERVDEARAAETAAGWEQQLLQVLDYTAWHQFVVKVDRGRGDGWQPVTRRLHGALSGGEKAIVLHLPLFAAAAAHYQATPVAPRLILLDEVFVGVDSTNRGQLLELLVGFDLDMVLTSDHEWCDYQELDGIAIHQLLTGDDGDDAVTTARFTWNGRVVLPDEDPDG
ncbi:TIGR02680 family protein [Actinophytocola xanthii]|uniref:TIGR02680 family protein n=1 Tax=Actinophytocola xanthii TaxID=1912961 RepID=A0A1Q8BYU9_9PSEU|nr:TIGR02680 family protein [Actinophytocola xanthii]OLF07294.1 TIGR02680 family protein [Actinophytocola xanthii]OLF07460.1 TIGR02680 family protein [Actinophytocola xanthii]